MVEILLTKSNGDSITVRPTTNTPLTVNMAAVRGELLGVQISDVTNDFELFVDDELNVFLDDIVEFGYDNTPGLFGSIRAVVSDPEQVLMRGMLVISTFDEVERLLSVGIKAGTAPLDDALGDQLLSDADWSQFSHQYTMSEWRRTNEADEAMLLGTVPYYYPFVDKGWDPDGRSKVPPDQVLTAPRYNYASNTSSGLTLDANDNIVGFTDSSTFNNWGMSRSEPSKPDVVLVTPSNYHGDIAFGNRYQGSIASPFTPARIDQFSPAITWDTCLDRAFSLAPGFTYDAEYGNMLSDLVVYPNKKGGLGIFGENIVDNAFSFLQTSATGVDLNPRQTSEVRTWNHSVFTVGETYSGTEIDPSNEFTNGVHRPSTPGTWAYRFSGSLEITTINYTRSRQFLTHYVAILKNGEIIKRHSLPKITDGFAINDDATNPITWDLEADINMQPGDTVQAMYYESSNRGAHDVRGDFSNVRFETTAVPLNYEGINVDLGAQFDDEQAGDLIDAGREQMNMVIEQDKQRDNHYIISQYYDWHLTGTRKDWSYRASNFERINLLEDQPRTITYSGAESDDRFNKEIIDATGLPIGSSVRTADDQGVTQGEHEVGGYFTPLSVASVATAGDPLKVVTPDPNNGIPHLYTHEGTDSETVETGIHLGWNRVINLPQSFFYEDDGDIIEYSGRVRTISPLRTGNQLDINWGTDNNLAYSTAVGARAQFYGEQERHLYELNNVKYTCDVWFTPDELSLIHI